MNHLSMNCLPLLLVWGFLSPVLSLNAGTWRVLQQEMTPVPGRSGGRPLSREAVNSLISEPPPLWGFQKKMGMLSAENWLPQYHKTRVENLQLWEESIEKGTVDVMGQPPCMVNTCQIVVNHHYNFIWIKSRKTGGTSLRASLGQICNNTYMQAEDVDMTYCGDFTRQALAAKEGDPEKWWEEYFVFGVVRNPYSRFASAHAFSKVWACYDQTLGEGCKDPFLLAKKCDAEKEKCCHPKMPYMNHVREQTSCMFTKEGELAVDFLMRTERMEEDYPVLAREINKRRNPGVPPLSEESPMHINSNRYGDSSYLNEFMKYPECLADLDKVFENEFRDLQYVSSAKL